MGRLLLLLAPFLLISGCGKYASLREARAACLSWKLEGGTYTWDIGPRPAWDTTRHGHMRFQEWPVRDCDLEEDTRQILGLVGPFEKGSTLRKADGGEGPWQDKSKWEIKTRFRY